MAMIIFYLLKLLFFLSTSGIQFNGITTVVFLLHMCNCVSTTAKRIYICGCLKIKITTSVVYMYGHHTVFP